jgi:hypothetical protein
MSRAKVSPVRRPVLTKRFLTLAVGGGAIVLLVYFLTFHSTRLPPNAPTARGTSRQSGNELEAVRESLRRDNDLAGCRNAVSQLNAYLARHPDAKKPAALTEDERKTLKQLQLDDDEVNEVSSQTFTPLDAQHLDQCFLLQETVRTLDLEGVLDRDRAAAAFGWVTRQVRLREPEGDACPPQFVLRRGWGSPLERSLVFLAVLDQLGIPGCMVAVLQDAKEPQFLVPGALAGGEIYLFDSRLGLPLPGTSPGSILTLAQLRSAPEAFAGVQADAERPLTAEQARRAEPYIALTLSGLAPRMRYLKEDVLGGSSKVFPASNAAALVQAFHKATDNRAFVGSSVQLWAVPRSGNCSLRVLRSFLPPSEGGVDRPTAPGKPWLPRLERFEQGLTPWQYLPAAVQSLRPDIDPGLTLRGSFARPFVELVSNPRRPREQMLRGRLEEATTALVDMLDDMQQLRTRLQTEEDPSKALTQWLDEARKAQADLLRAEEQAKRDKTPETLALVKTAQAQMADVWDKKKIEKPGMVLRAAAVPPLSAETAYLLALCKHEQAEQAQAALERRKDRTTPKDMAAATAAWKDAADRWKRFLDEYPGGRDEAAARLLWARALEKQGDRTAARDLLANPPQRTSPWEKITFRMRSQQLQ